MTKKFLMGDHISVSVGVLWHFGYRVYLRNVLRFYQKHSCFRGHFELPHQYPSWVLCKLPSVDAVDQHLCV